MAVDLGIERLIGQDQTIRFCYGGEGEIRTPDSLSTMPDFESGAFNRALPPLRLARHFHETGHTGCSS